jgi:N-acetylmuramoyl-L-alanine amidase
VISRRVLLGHGAVATFVVPGLPGRDAAAAPPRPRHAADPTAWPLVVLDPGHGGKDPGAIGVSGTYEKHIALAAACELRRQLVATRRFRVNLTRGDDHFIPLEQRVAIARAAGAALFVSMHADALGDHAVRGASVYTLADAASDAQTAALARRENAADRFAGPDVQGASPEVAGILASLVKRETRLGSARLARDLVGALGQRVSLLPNPDRHAGFAVLQAPDIPSVLVEMGFMSNPSDEAALRQAEHRTLIASAMRQAILAQFGATPGGPDRSAERLAPRQG